MYVFIIITMITYVAHVVARESKKRMRQNTFGCRTKYLFEEIQLVTESNCSAAS